MPSLHSVNQPRLCSPWRREHGDPNRSQEARNGRNHPVIWKARVSGLDSQSGLLFQNLRDTDSVAAIDVGQRSVVGQWPLAPCEGPSGMAIDSEQRRLFSVCSGNAKLVVLTWRTIELLHRYVSVAYLTRSHLTRVFIEFTQPEKPGEMTVI